jgi:hypothetical protein
MNQEVQTIRQTLMMLLGLCVAAFSAAAYAQPVVVEPGWSLTRTITFSQPISARYSAFDGLIYTGRREHPSGAGGLHRINADGTSTTLWTDKNVACVLIDQSDGTIFSSDDFPGQILRTPLSGSRQVWVSGWNTEPDPVGLAIAPDDYTGSVVTSTHRALVIDHDSGPGGADQIVRWRLDQAEGEQMVHGDDGTLDDGVDIAIGREHVYLVDVGADRIYRLNAGGTLTQVDILPPHVLTCAIGIAIDPTTQDLLVLDCPGRVVRVSVSGDPADGTLSEVITGLSGSFTWAGIDVTPDGSQIIVTDYGANAVYVFTNTQSPRLTLESDKTCYNVGETVTVELWMRSIAETIYGGQFFLEYDETVLDFVSAEPPTSIFALEVYEGVNEGAGTIDYATGIPHGGPGTAGNAEMAVLTFTALQQICNEPDLIVWRSHDPPSRLTDETGQPVTPTLVGLNVVDGQPPEISGLTVTGGNVDATCEFTVTFSATVTDDCCVNAGDVLVGVSLTTANATLGTANITKTQDDAKTVTIDGDVLVSNLTGCPAMVQVTVDADDCCDNSATTCEDTATVTDVTDPEITCPDDIDVNADAGTCCAVIDPGFASATDNCDSDPTVTWVRDDGKTSLDDPYCYSDSPITITWTAEDDCGNTDSCDQVITVSDKNELVVNIDFASTFTTTFDRCITFELWDCGPDMSEVVEQVIEFTNGSSSPTDVLVLVPCGVYDCVTARDRLHTLRRTIDPLGTDVTGTKYVADFTIGNGKELISGNLNDDYWIDILDFGVFSYQCGITLPVDTDCSTAPPHSDVSGNGLVDTPDFSFIQTYFLWGNEANCCGQPGKFGEGEGPITCISVAELEAMGVPELAAGDLNGDGWLDEADIVEFLNGARPRPQRAPGQVEDVDSSGGNGQRALGGKCGP